MTMQFVNEKDITIDYGKVRDMMKVITREINTVEEYAAWVREWREYNAGLVTGIKGLRNLKNGIKTGALAISADRETGINRAHNSKLALRPFAKKLHELRVERKANYKAGVYGDPTFKRDIAPFVTAGGTKVVVAA